MTVTTDKDVGREDLSVRRYDQRGMQVVELTNNLYYKGFVETWDRPQIARLLDELEPDLVHVQHLMYLSVGCLEEAKKRGLPLLFTLHDFWLECPRMGQLVHADGSICEQVDFARCGTCLPSFPWRQSAVARTTGKMLARVHALTRVDLGPLARGAARVRCASCGRPDPGMPAVVVLLADGLFESPEAEPCSRCGAFGRVVPIDPDSGEPGSPIKVILLGPDVGEWLEATRTAELRGPYQHWVRWMVGLRTTPKT